MSKIEIDYVADMLNSSKTSFVTIGFDTGISTFNANVDKSCIFIEGDRLEIENDAFMGSVNFDMINNMNINECGEDRILEFNISKADKAVKFILII